MLGSDGAHHLVLKPVECHASLPGASKIYASLASGLENSHVKVSSVYPASHTSESSIPSH